MPDNDFFIDYMDMDDFQRQLIDRKVNKSMVVTGCAGSGKSVIALHKTKQIAPLGSYAIIVFTKTLKQYFKDGISSLGLSNVYYYNEWKKLSEKPQVKYLIVDEIQDFAQEEIESMKKHGEVYFFFGDSDQSIMSFKESGTQNVEDTAYQMHIRPDELYFNYRLTKEVAEVAEKVGDIDEIAIKCKRHGEKPQMLFFDTFDEQLDEIARIVRNKSLTSVGILMPYNNKKTAASRTSNPKLSVEYVHEYFTNKGIPNEFKYYANEDTEMDLNFDSSNIKIMTWWCAKGLQFKDVFVPGCCINETDKRKAMYVALTRCSERLYILHSNNLSSFFDQVPDSLYANNEQIEDI